ncbi:MAG: hypothetical protein RIQ79_2317 [Verrucomicrobiota bacterium]
MKLLHVSALVIAVHAAVFVFIFATPGCRSTGHANKPAPEATAPTSVTPVADSIKPLPVANDGSVASSTSADSSVTPVSTAPISADGVIRFAPTRPVVAPVVESAPVPTSATHVVAKGESLWSISHKYGITIDELTAANQLAKTASLHLGQKLTVPAKAAAAVSSQGGDVSNAYTVASGDTLGSIARKQGTTASALRTANNLKGDSLRIGQKLVIPGNSAAVSAEGVVSAPVGSVPSARPAPQAGDATHTVVPGDSLGSIARKHGVRVGDVATLNNITDPAKIRVGQTLKLPVGAKPVSAKTPSTKPAAPAATTAEPAAAATPPVPVAPVTPVQTMAVPVIRID